MAFRGPFHPKPFYGSMRFCDFPDHRSREAPEQSSRWENDGKPTRFHMENTPRSIIWTLLSGSQEICTNIDMNTTMGQELQTLEGSVSFQAAEPKYSWEQQAMPTPAEAQGGEYF